MTQHAPAPPTALSGDSGAHSGLDPGPRCDLTELYVAQCDHCRHPERNHRFPNRQLVSWPATTFPARYPDECGECGDPIRPGDHIAWSVAVGGYVCGGCAMW